MRYLIDTNCCIYLFASSYPALSRRVLATPQGDMLPAQRTRPAIQALQLHIALDPAKQ